MLASVTGSTVVSYPNIWNEIIAIAKTPYNNEYITFTFTILPDALESDGLLWITSGYGFGGTTIIYQVAASTSSAYLRYATFMDTDYKSTTIVDYYYR